MTTCNCIKKCCDIVASWKKMSLYFKGLLPPNHRQTPTRWKHSFRPCRRSLQSDEFLEADRGLRPRVRAWSPDGCGCLFREVCFTVRKHVERVATNDGRNETEIPCGMDIKGSPVKAIFALNYLSFLIGWRNLGNDDSDLGKCHLFQMNVRYGQ